MHRPLRHSSLFVLMFVLAGASGCSESDPAEAMEGSGGSHLLTGGSSDGSGGLNHGDGGGVSTGGAATGGALSSGDGGTSSGGVASGGSGGSGGAHSGGTASGGASSGGMGSGGIEGGGSGGEASGGSGGSDGPTLPPITDYSQPGPFQTTTDNSVGPGGGYTVFRPEPLGEDGFLHAPIVFGPGIGQSVTVHTQMLTNFASHGFVVVGTPVLSGGPGDDGNEQKMRDGLEWIVEQNSTPGLYQDKIWTDHAVSMGFSVGGTAAVEIGDDPAVLTVVSIHGHTASAALHGTMLQTTGTGDTVGLPLQQNTYNTSEVPTFMATLTGASHGYIEQDGGGEERPAILAWMRYWIYGDAGAEDFFFGADCVLCTPPWENPQRKNWD